MSKLIAVVAAILLVACSFAQAQNKALTIVKMEATQNLVGTNNGFDEHIQLLPDGGVKMWTGRSMPMTATVVDVQDLRSTDGDLTITLSCGTKLVQTSGYSIDGIAHIYVVNEKNEKIEMTPQVTLSVSK